MSAKANQVQNAIVANGTKLPSFDMRYKTILSVIASVAAVPAAQEFGDEAVDIAADTIAIDAADFYTGFLVRATTDGTLPGGLAVLTDYYVIKLSDSSIQLATSLANALAGTAINLTTQASAASTNTLTNASPLTTGTVTVEGSNKGENQTDAAATWVELTTPVSLATTAKLEYPVFPYAFARIAIGAASGQGRVNYQTCVKTHGQA